MPELSVITAFLNEADNLSEFRRRVTTAVDRLGVDAEIVLVDDHSSDASAALARDWATSDRRVVYVRLSRNCGSHSAFSAGLAHCQGRCAVFLAADLQDPPEVIPQLYQKWREGFHVVWAVRERREGESLSTRFLAGVYYWLMQRLGLVEMPATGADFLLIDHKVIEAVNAITERHTSFLGMILWMGFRQTSIPYVKEARSAGVSKWTLSKKIKLFVDSVVSFSYAPIRFVSWFGLGLALCGFFYAAFVIIGWFVGYVVAGVGFAALMTVLLIGQGAILVSLGVIGEYLWRAFEEARSRPRYIVEEYLTGASPEHDFSPVIDSKGSGARAGLHPGNGPAPCHPPALDPRASFGPPVAEQAAEEGKPPR